MGFKTILEDLDNIMPLKLLGCPFFLQFTL